MHYSQRLEVDVFDEECNTAMYGILWHDVPAAVRLCHESRNMHFFISNSLLKQKWTIAIGKTTRRNVNFSITCLGIFFSRCQVPQNVKTAMRRTVWRQKCHWSRTFRGQDSQIKRVCDLCREAPCWRRVRCAIIYDSLKTELLDICIKIVKVHLFRIMEQCMWSHVKAKMLLNFWVQTDAYIRILRQWETLNHNSTEHLWDVLKNKFGLPARASD